ncbi:MAG: glucokinase [Pseudomonadota bacterium]
MSRPSDMLSLVADVGGTNTRVALADGCVLRPGSVERYRNAEHPSLGAVLSLYLAEQGHPDCDGACAAIAGPVEDGKGKLTNLDWQIDGTELAEAAQAETVAVLNDLQAQGYGVAHTPEEKLRPVLTGDGQPAPAGAAQIVIGVGTGFNIAPIYAVGDRHLVTPSEAGHVTLPVKSEEDLSLARFVGQTHGFADVEEVLSGRGIENIYAWLGASSGGDRASAAEIFSGFESTRDDRTDETARIFARILGTVAGDLALLHLPYGGIYFSGGVTRAFGPHLRELGFEQAFLDKGRFSSLMRRFSVHIIEDDFAALAGCAGFLEERMRH